MEFIPVLLVAIGAFLLCFLADKLYKKVFRNQAQHWSGTAVRLNKRYGTIGLLLLVFGVVVLFLGINGSRLMLMCSALLLLAGVGLVVHYLSFGVFYDEESFVLTTFGKKSVTYRFADIQGQKLYASAGNVTVVELYMKDGRTFQLQSVMTGMYEFMDRAFAGWLEQNGKQKEDCPFYDPEQSCWFPPVEE